MNKFGKRFILLAVIFLTGFVLVACGETSTVLDDAVKDLTLESILASGDTADTVTSKLTLPTKDGDVTIEWTSDTPATVAVDGEVTRPKHSESNVTVKLTAKLTFEEKSELKNFTIIVLKEEEPAIEDLVATTSITVTEHTTLSGDSGTNEAALFGLDPDMFTVIGDAIGSYSNTIGLNAVGGIRLYGDRTTGDGNTLLITVKEGYEIIAVEINFDEGKNSPVTAEVKLGDVVQDLGTEAVMNNMINFEDLSVSSFSIKNNNQHESTTHQVWVSSISITYRIKA